MTSSNGNIFHVTQSFDVSGIILCMRPANERQFYNVTSSPIGWVHAQNDSWKHQHVFVAFPDTENVQVVEILPCYRQGPLYPAYSLPELLMSRYSKNSFSTPQGLTHGGRGMHIYLGNLTIIGTDNDLLPSWCQAIIWTNAGIFVNWTLMNKLQWNFNQNSCIFIHGNAFKNVVWKMAAILSWPQCVNRKVGITTSYTPLLYVNQCFH